MACYYICKVNGEKMNIRKLNEQIEKTLHEEDDAISTWLDEWKGIYKRKPHPNRVYSYISDRDYKFTMDFDYHAVYLSVYYHPEKGFYTKTGAGKFPELCDKSFSQLWEKVVEEANKEYAVAVSVYYDPEGNFRRNVPGEVEIGWMSIKYYQS